MSTFVMGPAVVSAGMLAAAMARREELPEGAKALPDDVQARRAELTVSASTLPEETRQQRRARERREAKWVRSEAKRAVREERRWSHLKPAGKF